MILDAVVIAVVLGIAAQVLAERFKLPAILPLLLFGIAAGPSGLALFDPDELGHGLEVLVHVGVAVILFEGGLSLDLRELSRVGGAVRNLLTIGAAITTLGAAALAHFVVNMPWPTALLFGAIVMVTGPTVTAPLLRHMVAPRRLKTVITSEGLIIDALGATVAYLVLLWVGRAGLPMETLGGELVRLVGVGVILGFVAGSLARFATRARVLSGEIRNLAILAILLLFFLLAEHQAEQSGILVALVMGVTMSAGDIPDLSGVKIFKSQLTLLMISFVFVLLAAGLDIETIRALGWSGALVAVGLIVAVRPLSVFLSVSTRHLPLRERVALALLAPRGIVAAAVASLAAISLAASAIDGGELLEGLVYLVIIITGAWATLMAMVLPKLLGFVDDPSRRRAIFVGANPLTELLAGLVVRDGRRVVMVDAVSWRLDRFRDQDYLAVVGDARDAATYETAGMERDTLLVAATTNDSLNLLAAELAHTEFGVEHPVVTLHRPPEELGTRSRAWVDLLGGGGIDVSRWIRWIEGDRVELIDVTCGDETALLAIKDSLDRWGEEILVIGGWKDGVLSFRYQGDRLDELDALTLAVASESARERLHSLSMGEVVGAPEDDGGSAEGAGPEGDELTEEGEAS